MTVNEQGALARRAEATDVHHFAAKNSPALIYTNSIASARIFEVLAPKVPALTHMHEVEIQFRMHSGRAMSSLFARTSQFIACSHVARDNLARHGVPAAQIETVHESIPVGQVRAERTRQHVFQELQIPDDALLIAGCGTLGWLKGSDLFIHLARAVCQQRSCAYFAWVGGGSANETVQFEHDVRVSGLAEKIRFTGKVMKTADYMAAADVFVLPSREDSYPLVCLEAAALEKPIVCFADAGGMPEFVEEDCGFVVPYLDIMAMAERVVFLLDRPDRRRTIGVAARHKVTQRHDINETAPRIMKIIERTITGG